MNRHLALTELASRHIDSRRRAYQLALAEHRRAAEPVVARVRSRLVEQGGTDALDALDKLSPFEQYVLAQREIGATSC